MRYTIGPVFNPGVAMHTRRKLLAMAGAGALGAGLAMPAAASTKIWNPGLKTFSTAGKQKQMLSAARETVLFERKGPGCLTHQWYGGDWPKYNQTRLRYYVDGESVASIDMEYGMGHGVGFDDRAAPWGVRQMGMTGHTGGFYNTFHIPFGKSLRVTGQLARGVQGTPPCWWIMRGTVGLPVQIAGINLPSAARLKLYKHEHRTVERLKEFSLLDTKSAGALFLVAMAAKSPNWNFMEGCIRAYFDGAKRPELLSSGLEDYFCGTYYFASGRFYTAVSGLTHKAKLGNAHQFSAYRFHDSDPVFFQNGLRLTARCGEEMDGFVFGDPQATTYTTYAWAYEW